MSQFRAKKFDIGCFTNIKIIRDHSKRKAFRDAEPERYRTLILPHPINSCYLQLEQPH